MNLLKEKITDKKTITSLIPQADPFVMVDKLLHYSEGKVVSGLAVSGDLLFLDNGHFAAPGLIENMAQTVALYTGYGYFMRDETPPEGYIGAISRVQIDNLPELGAEITTTVQIMDEIMGITLVEAVVECRGAVLATCRMKTSLARE